MITGIDVQISKSAELTRLQLIRIGNHVGIDMCVYISTALQTGDYVHIAPHVSIIGGAQSKLKMGHFTNLSTGAKVICGSDDFTKGMLNPIVPAKYRHIITGTVTMEDFSAVGVNSTVMPGVTMAIGSVLGANSLLTKDTEPWTIYVGSPAKPLKMRDKTWILESAKELGYVY